MSSSEEVSRFLRNIVTGNIPTENVALVKNVPSSVSDEALTNFLEVVSDNRLDVENIYSYDTARDLRLVLFTTRFQEEDITEKLSIKRLKNTVIVVTRMESPEGIMVRNIPDKATGDTFTFYFEKVLRKGGIELEVNTQIFNDIGIAVIEVEDSDKGLPLIFDTEPHKVCGNVITVEPYVQVIHDNYIAALRQELSTKPTRTGKIEPDLSHNTGPNIEPRLSHITGSDVEPDILYNTKPDMYPMSHNVLKKHNEKDSLYMKNVDIPGEGKPNYDCQGEMNSDDKSSAVMELFTPSPFEMFKMNDRTSSRTEAPQNNTRPSGNLRIFLGNSNQQVNRSVNSDSNTASRNKSGDEQSDSYRNQTQLIPVTGAESFSVDLSDSTRELLTMGARPKFQETNKPQFKHKKPPKNPKSQLTLPSQGSLVNYTGADNREKWNPEETSNSLVARGPRSATSTGHIETEIKYSDRKENVIMLQMSNLTKECPNCDIKFDVGRGIIVIRGTEKDVQLAKLKHFEIIHTIKQESLRVSKNTAAVISTPHSKHLIDQNLRSESVKAYVAVSNDGLLQVFALSKNDAKKAMDIVKGSLLTKNISYNESHFQFLNGSQWTSLVETLQTSCKSMVKIDVVRDQKVIIVEGWKQEVLQTVKDIQVVLTDNSDKSVSVKLTGGQATCYNRFLQDKMKDVRDTARMNKVLIKDNRDGNKSVVIEIRGNKDGVEIVELQLRQIVGDIWHGKLDFGRISNDKKDQALMSKVLSSEKGADFVRSFEQQHRCVVEVDKGQNQVSGCEFTSNSNGEEDWCSDIDEGSASDSRCSDDSGSDTGSGSEPESRVDIEEDFLLQSERRYARRPVVRASNKEITSQKCGETMIRIKQGDITKEIADALVNVVPMPSMRVKDSAIYSAFVQEGGDELEMYFKNRKSNADRNVVCTQSGGNLNCRIVFHLMLEKWQMGESEKTLQLALESCFQWCSFSEVTTIAFPVVGVGKYLKYPPSIVAKLMISEAKKAVQNNRFKEISFVVYDESILKVYKQALEGIGDVASPFSHHQYAIKSPFSTQPIPSLYDTEQPSARNRLQDFSPVYGWERPKAVAYTPPSQRFYELDGTQDYLPPSQLLSARTSPHVDLPKPVSARTSPYVDSPQLLSARYNRPPNTARALSASGLQRHRRHKHPRQERKRERSDKTRMRPRQQQHRRQTLDNYSNPGNVTVTVNLFAESTTHGEKVRSELSKKIKAEFLALDEIQHERIKNLSKDMKKKIFEIDACKRKRVILTINAEKLSIAIKGEKSEVNSTKSDILLILLDSETPRDRERQPRQRQHKRGTKESWKELCENPPTPDYWKHFRKGFSSFDPVRNVFGKPRVEYEVVDGRTHSAILQVINKTWRADLVGQGNDAKNLNHKRINVTKIERIENFHLYRKYSIKRIEFFENKHRHHGNINKFQSLDKTRHSTGPIELNKHMDQSILMSDIYPEINEHYLFHGTTNDKVDNILTNGLDFRRSSEKAMLGRGTYAAESSTKADQYADEPTKRSNKNRKMLLIRMLLGNIFVATQPNKYSKPPCQCMQTVCANPKHDEFDSIVGDLQGQHHKLFREFVVYSQDQCYPEYLITYDRV